MKKFIYRKIFVYKGLFKAEIKQTLAYPVSIWLGIFSESLLMTIAVFFWKAIFIKQTQIGGMDMQQTINYILIAQIFAIMIRRTLIGLFGDMVKLGTIGVELLKPIEFQERYYIHEMSALVAMLILQSIPLGFFGWLVLGLRFPTSPGLWFCFIVTLFVGRSILFFFDWLFISLSFYTTETWGLYILRESVVSFFSGAILPLPMMPIWLRTIAEMLPFSQSLYVPVAILNGIIKQDRFAGILLNQLFWLAAMFVLSKVIFNRAVKAVTVQGG